ncbi:sterol desaturase family protein [Paucibacter sp. R3-3]|uniref:Sterol desaturase family protein n=1 Tax=Roseateles agri TaxID=3098619 RepID=A0ABU5DRT8_9BURK|nr:sterol desaturase family protein [Paucibacter sp. R3-3]MDY0749032.1 sterol desaturase family protein [Paucibacter sp. R3-3]
MFALEHSKAAYWADFAIYALAIGGTAISLPMLGPRAQWMQMAGSAALGLAAWPLIEYLVHRFILHGMEPFRTWHLHHHDRPTALISSPTALSATLIAVLVFAPAAATTTFWRASALTLGVVIGYFGYAVCHHSTHHWRSRGEWLKERKRWHAIHHRASNGLCYGVTFTLWDRVFGTAPPKSGRQSKSS